MKLKNDQKINSFQALFTRFPSKLLTNTGFTSVSNMPNDEACAEKCLERERPCLSIDYNPNSKSKIKSL